MSVHFNLSCCTIINKMNSTASIGQFLMGFYPLFYLKTPSGSSFKNLSEVPNYVEQVGHSS